MPHFVITQRFDGGETFAVEFFHECKRADGRAYVHSCHEITDETAARPLNELIDLYKAGIRPKKSPPSQPEKDNYGMSVMMEKMAEFIDTADEETAVKLSLECLERMAKHGRTAWEKLAELIAKSDDKDEIQSFLADIGDGQI